MNLLTEGGERRVVSEVDGGSGTAATSATLTTLSTRSTPISTTSTPSTAVTTSATSTTSTTLATAGLSEPHVDINDLLLLAFPVAGLVLGLTGKVLALLLGEGLSVGPLLVLGALVRLADIGARAELSLALSEFGKVLVVGLGLRAFLFGSSGLSVDFGGSSVRVGGVSTLSVLSGEGSTSEFILPFAVAFGSTPAVVNLLLVLTNDR